MNVLELCLSPDLGGLELYCYRSARSFLDKCNVTAVLHPDGKLYSYFDKSALNVEDLTCSFKALPIIGALKLAKIIDTNNIDLIHVHWTKDLPLVAIAKRLSKSKPKIISTRQIQITRSKDDLYHNFIYSEIDLNITITHELERDMRAYLNPMYANRIMTHYYGVSKPEKVLSREERFALRNDLGIEHDTCLIGLLGRIKHYKGQHLLIEALIKALEDGQDVAALIIGQGMEPDYLEDLKSRVEALGLQERIIFMGFVDNPKHWMQACDVITLTSIEETFGLVLAEAMRCGVAVVGSDRGGVPEIIEHGVSGLLFKSGSSEDLYKQLRKLWSDVNYRERLAEIGKQRADRMFDEKQHFQRLYDIASQLASV